MSIERNLQLNDIVHLSSGSPDLKVVAVKGDRIDVEWINERGNWARLSDRPAVCFTPQAPINSN